MLIWLAGPIVVVKGSLAVAAVIRLTRARSKSWRKQKSFSTRSMGEDDFKIKDQFASK